MWRAEDQDVVLLFRRQLGEEVIHLAEGGCALRSGWQKAGVTENLLQWKHEGLGDLPAEVQSRTTRATQYVAEGARAQTSLAGQVDRAPPTTLHLRSQPLGRTAGLHQKALYHRFGSRWQSSYSLLTTSEMPALTLCERARDPS